MAAKKESTFINMTLTLLIVTVVASFSLAGIYNLTKDKIEQAKIKKTIDAIGLVVPEFNNEITKEMFNDGDLIEIYPAKKDDVVVGYAVKTYSDKGFSGRVWIMVGFLPDGTIYNTAVLDHKETPGLGDKMDVAKSDFPKQFQGMHPNTFALTVKKDGGAVDAITAATITSRAFCDAVDRAFQSIKELGGNE